MRHVTYCSHCGTIWLAGAGRPCVYNTTEASIHRSCPGVLVDFPDRAAVQTTWRLGGFAAVRDLGWALAGQAL